MKRQRVLRFLLLCLFAGAFVGLVAGLAFGAGTGEGSVKIALNPVSGPQQTGTTLESDPFAGQPMSPEKAKLIGANEMGFILVVVYNNIDATASESTTRTPDQLRDDLALLDSKGFYPINIGDLVSGDIDIPAGMSPVAITFDGSSPGQYRILDDDTLDPNCAVGVMQSLVEDGYWHAKATFFCLLDVVPNENEVFGQTERRMEKLRNLVDWGYEVGSNTKTRLDLSAATKDSISSELAESQVALQDLIGSDYSVTSISVPYGRFPKSTALLASGASQETTYQYSAAVGLDNAPCPSPYSTLFKPLRIPRIASAGETLAFAIDELKNRPGFLYISDGDPTTVSAPYALDSSLGEPLANLGRPVVRY